MVYYSEKIGAMRNKMHIPYTFIDGIDPDWDWLL